MELLEVVVFTGKPEITANAPDIPRTTMTKIAIFPSPKPALILCMNQRVKGREIKDQSKEQPVLLWRTQEDACFCQESSLTVSAFFSHLATIFNGGFILDKALVDFRSLSKANGLTSKISTPMRSMSSRSVIGAARTIIRSRISWKE